AAARSANSLPLCGARFDRMHRASLAESCVSENAFAGFNRWIDSFLRGHECVLVVERPRLCEKFWRTDSGAHGRAASVQRDAKLDVFPQRTPERSRFHAALYCLHESRPK